jgi:lipoprotein-anchoring transpeptidase ErfK/SrfK
MTLNKLLLAISLIFTLALTGCVSSGASSYGNAVSVSYADRDKASSTAKTAHKNVRKLKKSIVKLERSKKRLERKLKRLSKRKATKQRQKIAKGLAKGIAKDKRAIKLSKKALVKAERHAAKSQRNLDRAKRKAITAEKRRKAHEIRQAQLEKAKAERKSKGSGSLFALSSQGKIKYTDYKARTDGGFKLPAIPTKKMKKQFLRQRVNYRSFEKTGTLIVDTKQRYLYLVEGGGKAMRYGIGVGKSGFEWAGEANIAWKQEWPKWTPPQEMIDRKPKLARYGGENGMKGGPKNPLGARALYIHQNGKDTLYRLHGSPQWASIGTAASSGCIRLINQDIIDLYSRVRNGAKIIVKQG